jgi:hypothetical protein
MTVYDNVVDGSGHQFNHKIYEPWTWTSGSEMDFGIIDGQHVYGQKGTSSSSVTSAVHNMTIISTPITKIINSNVIGDVAGVYPNIYKTASGTVAISRNNVIGTSLTSTFDWWVLYTR